MPLLFFLDEGAAPWKVNAAAALGFVASVGVTKETSLDLTAASVAAEPNVQAAKAFAAQVAADLAFAVRHDAVATLGLTAASVATAQVAAAVLAESVLTAAGAMTSVGSRHVLAEVALDTATSLLLVTALQWAATLDAEANAEVVSQTTLQGEATLGVGAAATLLPASLLYAVAAASLTQGSAISSQAHLATRAEDIALVSAAATTWSGGLAYLQAVGLSAATAAELVAAVQAVGALALGASPIAGAAALRAASAEGSVTATPAVAPQGHLTTRVEAVALDSALVATALGHALIAPEVGLASAAAASAETARTAAGSVAFTGTSTIIPQATLQALQTLGLAVQAALVDLGIPPGDALDIVATVGLTFASVLVVPSTLTAQTSATLAPAGTRTVRPALALDAAGAAVAATAGLGARADWGIGSTVTITSGSVLAAQAALAVQASAALADMIAGSGDVSAALAVVPTLSFLPQVAAAGGLGFGVAAAQQMGAHRDTTAIVALAAATGLPSSTVRAALAQVGLSATATLSDVIAEIGAVVLQATPHLALDARVVAGADLALSTVAQASAAAAAQVLSALGLPLDPNFWAGLAGEEIEQLLLRSPLLTRWHEAGAQQRARLANRPSRIRRRP
jgi:hypothetical protein